ncbi:hypothetical protein Ndes2526B_g08030 [Nannochloris sp. 'desiccata']
MSKSKKSGAEVLSPQETVKVKLVLSGERDKLKKLAKEKLELSGWTDDLRRQCREYAASLGIESATHEGIVNEVQRQGKSQVPDHIKAEILAEIRTILEKS